MSSWLILSLLGSVALYRRPPSKTQAVTFKCSYPDVRSLLQVQGHATEQGDFGGLMSTSQTLSSNKEPKERTQLGSRAQSKGFGSVQSGRYSFH